MSWTIEQEELILDTLMAGPSNQDELIKTLRSAKIGKRKAFGPSTTDRSLLSKSRSLSQEALTHDILALFPPPAEKPKKKTAAERRAEMFAKKPKMDPKEKTRRHIALALGKARSAMEKRERTTQKAQRTRLRNKRLQENGADSAES